MSKNDILPYRGNSLPELSRAAVDCLPDLPATTRAHLLDIFRSDTAIMARDAEFVETHGRYLDARINQVRKAHTLVDERISIAAKIADMDNALIEIQRASDHQRWQNEQRRNNEKVHTAYENRIGVEKKEAELARAHEVHIRAQRNCDAAERVAPIQADQWYAEAEARRHNAFAERQDAAADLARGTPALVDPAATANASARQRAEALAVIENQIELERERGNAAGVMSLVTLRARLKAA